MGAVEQEKGVRKVGRYVLFQEVAHGGMATVHLGRLRGPAGFARTVAIKRLHPPFARDPEFVSMFLDEARLAARIQHPNVVSVLDVVAADGELFLVMDYVHGEAFSKLLKMAQKRGERVPANIVVSIVASVLYGLHAAHEARSERGEPLEIVHRDVSPQNVLIGVDGIARVLDFGIAKAAERAHAGTRDGQIKGKLPYMAPEQVTTGTVDRRTDVYSASVMLWEALTGQKFFEKGDMGLLVAQIVNREHDPPSRKRMSLVPRFDDICMKGLARDPKDRFQTAREMALALEQVIVPATAREVGEWVASLAETKLRSRQDSISEVEGKSLPPTGASDFPLNPRGRASYDADDDDSGSSDGVSGVARQEAKTVGPPGRMVTPPLPPRPFPGPKRVGGPPPPPRLPAPFAPPPVPEIAAEAPSSEEAIDLDDIVIAPSEPPPARPEARPARRVTADTPTSNGGVAVVSVARHATWALPMSKPARWAALGCGVGVVMVLLLLLFTRSDSSAASRDRASAGRPAGSHAPSMATAVSSVVVSRIAPTPDTATSEPAPQPPNTGSTADQAPSADTPTASTSPIATTTHAHVVSSPPPPPRRNCSPPYTVSPDGIRIPKPECR